MGHFYIIMLLIIMLALIYGGNAKLKIHVPTKFYAGKAITGSCVSKVEEFRHGRKPNIDITSDACTVNSNEIGTVGDYYQRNFTIICANGSHNIRCQTNGMRHINAEIRVKVAEKPPPKIINKPCNITISVGLPVTFRCYVKGDPDHYWVGWMSRNAIIQPGEECSMSTSPSFKSTNGTTHYLTVHTVKQAGKYDCKVYSLAGDVEDFITHEVIISDDTARLSTESSVGLLKNLLGIS